MAGRTGRDVLARWLADRARTSASRFVALEEALLTGRFARYSARRLAAFGLTRALAAFVHLVELTWLYEIFSAKPFIASIALQNVTLVADAFFWGALEGYRRRARELGATSEAAALGGRWLAVASWVAAFAIALPVGVAIHRAKEPSMLHVYAIVCGVRLAADVLLRTYYSGVFAHHRVHRPIWATLSGPVLVIGITLLTWERLGGWSFIVALAGSVLVSRALLLIYTNRAYRRFRIPRPQWRRFARHGIEDARVVDRGALLAGSANLATRLGGVVLLAALVPSLTSVAGPDDELTVEPFAFALHLAAPFILIASQWAFVFYHDWKRVEGEDLRVLGRMLERRLLIVALVIGALCSLLSTGLVLLYMSWDEAWPTLVALFASTTGLSVWTSLQLRRFSHGDHLRQVASSIALIAIVGVALASNELGALAFYVALGLGPWLAIATHAVLERLRRPVARGEVDSVATFLRALTAARAVVVWEAHVVAKPGVVATRLAERLGTRGALVRVKERIVWFEQAPHTSRLEWLACAGGQIRALDRVPPPYDTNALAARALVAAPDAMGDLDRLAAEHARLFPEGFVLRLDAPPPAAFLALAPFVRQAIWRDALRFRAGARGRSGWFVSSVTHERAHGKVTVAVFVAPRSNDESRLIEWRNTARSAEWRLSPRQGTKRVTEAEPSQKRNGARAA